jgi:hypothetical protein
MAGYRVYVRATDDDTRHHALCVLSRPDGWYLWRAQCPPLWMAADLARVPTARATEEELRRASAVNGDAVLLSGA